MDGAERRERGGSGLVVPGWREEARSNAERWEMGEAAEDSRARQERERRDERVLRALRAEQQERGLEEEDWRGEPLTPGTVKAVWQMLQSVLARWLAAMRLTEH